MKNLFEVGHKDIKTISMSIVLMLFTTLSKLFHSWLKFFIFFLYKVRLHHCIKTKIIALDKRKIFLFGKNPIKNKSKIRIPGFR